MLRMKMKKNLSIFIFSLVVLVSTALQGCYAFLQADRLIYAGTIAKKQLPVISVDTISVEYSNQVDNHTIDFITK